LVFVFKFVSAKPYIKVWLRPVHSVPFGVILKVAVSLFWFSLWRFMKGRCEVLRLVVCKVVTLTYFPRRSPPYVYFFRSLGTDSIVLGSML
jgi:hypothetical protein